MSYVFGIDLGTTYSCIAYQDEYGKPVVLPNSIGENTTPSVVMVDGGTVTVGAEAKRMVEVEPEKTVQFIKRKMGRDDDSVTVDGKVYHAPEISAYILKQLVDDANSYLRQTGVLRDEEEVRDVVITCPAYFGMPQRDATKLAGEKFAGLNVLDIINEPTAAAISYGISGVEKDETVLVYDLGGGTFDITVMSIKNKNITVICTGGDDTLGGKDWDEKLQEYVIRRFEEDYGEDLSEDPEAVAGLYIDVESWKKALTAPRGRVTMSVRSENSKLREELTREKFNELTVDLLNMTRNKLDEVLAVAEQKGYPLSRIDRFLLVGGSSRMPQVAEMIEREYHVTPMLADPEQSVAKGAAIFAANSEEYQGFLREIARDRGTTVEQLQNENLLTGEMDRLFALRSGGEEERISITNVLSCTYGIQTIDPATDKDVIVNMLMMNDPLPAHTTQTFVTHKDNQPGAKITIYESRSDAKEMDIEGRTPLTEVELKFTKRVPRDTKIDITMALDNSGILHIIASERLYGSSLDTTFQIANQMSEEEMSTAIRRFNESNYD